MPVESNPRVMREIPFRPLNLGAKNGGKEGRPELDSVAHCSAL